MTHPFPKAQTARWQHLLTLALVISIQTTTTAWAQSNAPTAPSQNPLISQGNVVPPNMMVTLDTSWSMIFPYMPEGDVKLPGGTVKFPGFTSVIIHPDDTRFTVDQGRSKGDGGAIPGDPNSSASVFQLQMRSPDVNSIYYDPRVTYKPWLISIDPVTKVETRYPDASPKQALFDPDKPAYTDPTTKLSNFADLTLNQASKTAVWCNTNPTISGDKLSCASSVKPFNPGLYYRLDASAPGCPTVSVTQTVGTSTTTTLQPTPTDARCYIKFDVNGNGTFKNYPTRTDCGGKTVATCTAAQERQNFANWFVYYRTRIHMAQAALPETFLQLKDNKLRTGWATIHQGATTDTSGITTRNVISGVQTMDATRKQDLVKWIRSFQSDNTVTNSTPDPKLRGGTPLLAAMSGIGDYFSRTDPHGPWANDPVGGDSNPAAALSCRRSYNVLITDGYYTDSGPKTYVSGTGVAIGNEDGTNGPSTITGPSNQSYTYKAKTPYLDNRSGTLADVAMHYWKNDLFPDLPNGVQAGKDALTQDPAFWQHLVQFNIGLGVVGNIPYNDLSNQLKLLTAGTKGWWDGSSTVSGNDPRFIDDLLHAAINSRGQYFSVKNPVDLTNSLTTALTRAGRQDGMTQAGIALQSQYTSSTNIKYVPEFTTEQWIGDVKAYTSDVNGTWSTKPLWSAVERLPTYTTRNIVTWTGSVGASFLWGNIGATNQSTVNGNLPNGATGQQLIDYIRGDTSNEDAALTLNLFRQRDSLLADIVNSTPTLLQGNVDLQYDKLPSTTPGQATYAAFRTAKAARAPLLFVGDNGGMLHAFADYDTSTPDINPSTARGQEVFAYVPQAAMSGLGNLARRDYGTAGNPHRFFVDGPLTESDAYFNGQWQNVLIGTMGAGGRAIFALNIQNVIPKQQQKLGANSIMWEKSSVDDADFGYMLGDAQVGMLPDGSWKVFVGNGPYSTNGHAVLMIIDLATGVITKKDVSAATDTGNGLGAVQLVKNSNQQVVNIYAGDLKGQLWRFDADSTGAVSIGLAGNPLFVAPPGQAITAAPSVVTHPKGGNMVVFGTGKLFDDTDPDDTTLQSLYGVWDAPTTVTSGTSPSNLGRTDLVEQVIVLTPVATNSTKQSFFDITFNNVDYKTKRGWFIDLKLAPGQRDIYPSTVVRDFVLVNTVVPVKASDTISCDSSNGVGYTFVLPAVMDGTYPRTQLVDTNGDGIVDKIDAVASVYSTQASGRYRITLKNNPTTPAPQALPCSMATDPLTVNYAKEKEAVQLPGGACKIRGRIWRQILTPPQP